MIPQQDVLILMLVAVSTPLISAELPNKNSGAE